MPEVKDKEPWAEDLLCKLWEDSLLNATYGLVHDLYRISQSKVNGPFAANMTYHGVATLMGALRGQKAFVGPMSGEQKRRIAEAKRIEFAALQQRVHDVEHAFKDFVGSKSGELMVAALDRMDALTANCKLYSAVCEEFCRAHVRIECIDSHLSVPKLVQAMKQDIGLKDICVLYLLHASDVPLPRAAHTRAAKDEQDDPASTPRMDRGNWQDLLGSAASLVVSSPSHSALLLIHSLRAPKKVPVPFYNLDFTKVVSTAGLNVDYEAHLAWEGSPQGRPPRRLTVAVRTDTPNAFNTDEGIMPYSRIITMPSPKGTEDYFKVQNVTTLRDTDVADTSNLSVPERQAILGASTFKGLFLKVLTSLPAAGDFNKELNSAPLKRRKVAKKEDSDGEESRPEVKDEDETEDQDQEMASAGSPGAAGRSGSLSGPGASTVASSPPKPAPASAGKTNMPLLVVSLGLSNGNVAVAAAETVVASDTRF